MGISGKQIANQLLGNAKEISSLVVSLSGTISTALRTKLQNRLHMVRQAQAYCGRRYNTVTGNRMVAFPDDHIKAAVPQRLNLPTSGQPMEFDLSGDAGGQINLDNTDMTTDPDYVDRRVERVGYNIYLGGFYLFVEGISRPVLVRHEFIDLRMTAGRAVTRKIRNSRDAAVAVVKASGDGTTPYTFFQPAGMGEELLIVPSTFSPLTTPRTIAMMREAQSKYFNEVARDLTLVAVFDVGLGLVFRPIANYTGKKMNNVFKGPDGYKSPIKSATQRKPPAKSKPRSTPPKGATESAKQAAKQIGGPWRCQGRDVVVVQTSQGAQAFYRRGGGGGLKGRVAGKGAQPGEWAPFDGFGSGGHFNKDRFFADTVADEFYSYGNSEFNNIAKSLDAADVAKGVDFRDNYGGVMMERIKLGAQ